MQMGINEEQIILTATIDLMKTPVFFFCLYILTGCTNGKQKDYLLALQPETGKTYTYAAEDKFQIMIKLPEGDHEIYAKHMFDYTVKYNRKDSMLNGMITFKNFRIEFEDGHGVQIFDTKFDSADWKNIELWFYYSMLKKNVSFGFGANSRVKEVKGVEQLKQTMIKMYESNGIANKELSLILRNIVDNFVVNRMAYENYSFYTGLPLQKDSSYSISFSVSTPVHHTLSFKYNFRSETDTTLTLSGKGLVKLKDSLKQEHPFSLLKTKNLSSDGFDEILLQKETNVMLYRKSYFNLSDTILLASKLYPARIIIEKEIKLKKPE